MTISKTSVLCLYAALLSTAGLADSLVQTATLKDFQTVGTTTKKQKHQQYDLVLDTSTTMAALPHQTATLPPTQFVCFHAGIQSQRTERRGHQHLGQ